MMMSKEALTMNNDPNCISVVVDEPNISLEGQSVTFQRWDIL